LKAILRYYSRMAVYRTPASRFVATLRAAASPRTAVPVDWDSMLAGSFAPYLKPTTSIAVRDGLTCALLGQICTPTSVLDLGCGNGSLASAMKRSGVGRYVGTDISRVAIETASRRCDESPAEYPASCTFIVSDLKEFGPTDDSVFDAICFSEVLYYLGNPAAAVTQVQRYVKWLSPTGLFSVSMKDDPKSHAIFHNLATRFDWVTGALVQEKDTRPAFRVTVNQERPAFLVAVLRPKSIGQPSRSPGAPP